MIALNSITRIYFIYNFLNVFNLKNNQTIVSMLHTDFYTCGIAPFKERFQFLLLCYEKSDTVIKTQTKNRLLIFIY